MNKKYKKIYIEITNRCNLHCSFCGKNKRTFKDMTLLEFKEVIAKIKPYTDFIYLHVKGEPLLHNEIDGILSICDDNFLKVNITTNGVFLKKRKDILEKHSCVRQINVSLHSENNKLNYFDEVFSVCKSLSTKVFISYRIWNLNRLELDDKSTEIVDKIINFYKLSPDTVDKLYNCKSVAIDINTYVNKDNLFVWPDSDNNLSIDGFCYALKTHIGVLSNGDVVPCCLDSNGEIKLGNIFVDDLDSIINSDNYKKLEKSFKENKSLHGLCKNCNFRNRFIKNL